jgi:ABC-2 type transport system permease protein
MRTLRFLLRKEFLQIFRDRTMLRLLIAMPLVQLVVLSNAATFEVREAGVYVVDLDRSAASRGLVERMTASGLFRVTGQSASMAHADDALLDRSATLILGLPAGLERDLVRNGHAPVQLILNAEDGAAAGIVRGHAIGILGAYAAELSAAAGGHPATAGGLEIRTRAWYNPTLDYQLFMVPGILVVLVTIVATTMAAMNIVREKELGTLEQLNVTPVTKAQFIASKLLPFWILALLLLCAGLLVAHFGFGVPVRGSVALLLAAGAVYLVAALGIGLWISTVAETQQQAMFVSFAINMIYLLMSGLFTPVASMPAWAQWIAEASPVKHFIVIARAILLKGAGVEAVALPLLILAFYGAAVITLATLQHSKRSDATG